MMFDEIKLNSHSFTRENEIGLNACNYFQVAISSEISFFFILIWFILLIIKKYNTLYLERIKSTN